MWGYLRSNCVRIDIASLLVRCGRYLKNIRNVPQVEYVMEFYRSWQKDLGHLML